MKNIKIPYSWSVYLIWSLHLVGFVAMQYPLTRSFFEALTPLNLLICSFFAIYFHEQKTRNFWIWVAICYFFGYFYELLGVKTGLIFGKYAYLDNLGIKIFDIPLIIGLNWFLLAACIAVLFHTFKIPNLLKIIFSALAMTLTDILIEPVAVEHDWWHWFNMPVPFQNYVAWFVGAFFLMTCFFLIPFPKKNTIGLHLWFAQILFFTLHWIFVF